MTQLPGLPVHRQAALVADTDLAALGAAALAQARTAMDLFDDLSVDWSARVANWREILEQCCAARRPLDPGFRPACAALLAALENATVHDAEAPRRAACMRLLRTACSASMHIADVLAVQTEIAALRS